MLKLFYAFLKISFVLSNHTSWLIFLSSAATLDKEICAGALISEHWIITAAQCLYDRSAEKIIAYNNRKDQYRLIAQYFIHEAYDHESKVNDIALLKPVLPFSVDENTQPVCITNQIDKLICGKGGCERKLQVSFPKGLFLLKEEACREYYKNTPIVQRITDRIYCLFGTVKQPKNSRKCKTLAGYPFTYDNELGETVLTGIISHGWTCSMSSFPTIVTKISSYYKWMMDNTLPGNFTSPIICSQDRGYLNDINEVYKSLIEKASMMRDVDREQNFHISNSSSNEWSKNDFRDAFLRHLKSYTSEDQNTSFPNANNPSNQEDRQLTDILSNLRSYFPLMNTFSTLSPKILKILSTKSSIVRNLGARIARQGDQETAGPIIPFNLEQGDVIIPPLPGMEEKQKMVAIEKPGAEQGEDIVLVDYPEIVNEIQMQALSNLADLNSQQEIVTPGEMPAPPILPKAFQIESTQLPPLPLTPMRISDQGLGAEIDTFNCENGLDLGCSKGIIASRVHKSMMLLLLSLSLLLSMCTISVLFFL